MEIILAGMAVLGLWFLAGLKTSRPDGTLTSTHTAHAALGHITPFRAAATAYLDLHVDATELRRFITAHNEQGNAIGITACVLAGVAVAIDHNPDLNRFTSGGRLYRRNKLKLTTSVLQGRLDRTAQVSAVGIEIGDSWTFLDLAKAMQGGVARERTGKPTSKDRELALYLKMPRPFLRFFVGLLNWLDDHNLLPAFYIDDDPLFCSAFVTNLGSIGMLPAYHHLYEYGNCPIFVMAGQIVPMPVVRGSEVVVRDMLHFRITFDERIDDGINANEGLKTLRAALEHPFEVFGDPAGASQPTLRGSDVGRYVAAISDNPK